MTRFTVYHFMFVRIRFIVSYLTTRPVRYVFSRMIRSSQLRILPTKHEWLGWQGTNLHWWCLYKTVFKFCKWLNYDAWRHFCDWSTGCRNSYPGIARLIHWFGKSTAGYAIGGGRCFHCNDERGDPINISQYDGDNPKSLLVSNVETWTEATMDGTDYRFSCITKCPCCGYKSQFSDGSP